MIHAACSEARNTHGGGDLRRGGRSDRRRTPCLASMRAITSSARARRCARPVATRWPRTSSVTVTPGTTQLLSTPSRGERPGQRRRQVEQGGLGRRVGREQRVGLAAAHRRDVHQAAPAGRCASPARRPPTAGRRRGSSTSSAGLPVVGGQLLERLGRGAPGVVDERRRAGRTARSHAATIASAAARSVTSTANEPRRPPPARRAPPRRRRARRSRAEQHPAPLGGQGEGDLPADAPAGAGDDGGSVRSPRSTTGTVVERG